MIKFSAVIEELRGQFADYPSLSVEQLDQIELILLEVWQDGYTTRLKEHEKVNNDD